MRLIHAQEANRRPRSPKRRERDQTPSVDDDYRGHHRHRNKDSSAK